MTLADGTGAAAEAERTGRNGGIDRQIRDAFRTHPQIEIIDSLPGMVPILGAELVVAAGDMTALADGLTQAEATEPPAWLRPAGVQQGTRAPDQLGVPAIVADFHRLRRTDVLRDEVPPSLLEGGPRP